LNAQDIVILKTLIAHKKLDNFEALPLRPFETDVRRLLGINFIIYKK